MNVLLKTSRFKVRVWKTFQYRLKLSGGWRWRRYREDKW